MRAHLRTVPPLKDGAQVKTALRSEKSRKARTGFGIAALLALAVGALAFPGCALPEAESQKPPQIAPRLEAARPLEVGDSHTFTFAADGIWYPAPFLVNKGQRMRVSYGENSAYCPDGAVRYRIGPLEQILISGSTAFTVTRPGAMLFYFDPNRGGQGFRGQIEVTVTRVA